MKVSVDGKDIFELSEMQKKVIMNDIPEDIFEEDMCRRIQYILEHKYERCLERLKQEWTPKLSKRYGSIPADDDAFCAVVFGESDYQDRKSREKN